MYLLCVLTNQTLGLMLCFDDVSNWICVWKLNTAIHFSVFNSLLTPYKKKKLKLKNLFKK